MLILVAPSLFQICSRGVNHRVRKGSSFMHQSIQLNKPTHLCLNNSLDRSPWWRGLPRKQQLPRTQAMWIIRGLIFIGLALALVCFALSSTARALLPPPAPDGGYPNQNTAEGENALFNLTNGVSNTALGYRALFLNTIGNSNTATGVGALYLNTESSYNTATGNLALYYNTGAFNAATGFAALYHNTTGNANTANGANALFTNTTGRNNTADGFNALYHNTSGAQNMASGVNALYANATGGNNTAGGVNTLIHNTTGNGNTALGHSAGSALTTGSNNIDIGNAGVAAESNTIRIGTTQQAAYISGISGKVVPGGVTVIVGANGKLGTMVSSERFKAQIKPMGKASEALLALKPVTFRYKAELDAESIPQFGLVAEEVEKVAPDLVARDEKGKAYTVRYEAVNAMLLNEFLKEHRKIEERDRKVQEQEATITELKSTDTKQGATIAQLQKEIKALTATVEKVSDQLQVRKTAPRNSWSIHNNKLSPCTSTTN